MFTGIIEGMGTIAEIRPVGLGRRFTIETDFDLDGTKIGDSICVSGACLTAVTMAPRRFQADVSPETLSRTSFQKAKVGERVNLERALLVTSRLDGHLVSGHIDGIGTIREKKPVGNTVVVAIETPPDLTPYLVEKGSIAVDGISLTVNHRRGARFDVSIIPHTGALTTMTEKKVGDRVNLEADMIGKYVESFLSRYGRTSKGTGRSHLDKNLLARAGFLNPEY